MWLVQVRQIDLVCIYTWIHLSFLGHPQCKNPFDTYMSIGHYNKKNLLSYTCHSACWKDPTFIYMSFNMLKGRHFHIHVIQHVQRTSLSYTCHSTRPKDATLKNIVCCKIEPVIHVYAISTSPSEISPKMGPITLILWSIKAIDKGLLSNTNISKQIDIGSINRCHLQLLSGKVAHVNKI